MGTGGEKIKIGPTTRHDLGVPDILDYGVYHLTDFLSLQEAVDAVPSGKTLVVNQDITLTTAIIISKPITIIGIKGYTIYQSTLNATCIKINCNNVTLDNLTLLGNPSVETSPTFNGFPYYRDVTGVLFTGGSGANRKNITVKNCNIQHFQFGIFAIFAENFVCDSNIIDNVFRGVYFSTADSYVTDSGWVFPGNGGIYQNDTTVSYTFTNNIITCTYGWLQFSRPIGGNFIGGSIRVSGNKLRGGGMCYENMLNSFSLNLSGAGIHEFTNNDCDSGVSGSMIITNNVFDLLACPSGRWQQDNWYQAIEPYSGARISGNVVRNHLNGVGFTLENCVITNNFFENCGLGHNGAEVGGGGVIISLSANPASGMKENCIISNNVFKDTYEAQGGVAIISINGPAYTPLMENYIIDSNIVDNASGPFIAMNNVKNVRVTNNLIRNCQSTQTGGYHWPDTAILCTLYVDAFYDNNIFINTLGAYGMSNAIAIPVSGTTTVGYNEASGCRYGMWQNWISGDFKPPTSYISPTYKEDGVIKSYMRLYGGSPSGIYTPKWVGEVVQDNSTGDFYMGYNTGSNTSWKKIT
jgi:hypothetical protein